MMKKHDGADVLFESVESAVEGSHYFHWRQSVDWSLDSFSQTWIRLNNYQANGDGGGGETAGALLSVFASDSLKSTEGEKNPLGEWQLGVLVKGSSSCSGRLFVLN